MTEEKTQQPFRDESARFDLSSKFFQEAPKQSLAFVNLTTSSGGTQDSGERKLVRSHVMYNVHQQRYTQEHELYVAWKLPNADSQAAFSLSNQEERERGGVSGPAQSLFPQNVEAKVFRDFSRHVDGQSGISQNTKLPNTTRDGGGGSMVSNFKNSGSYSFPKSEKQYLNSNGFQISESELLSQSIRLNTLSSGGIDPFDTLPKLRTATVNALIYHCKLLD